MRIKRLELINYRTFSHAIIEDIPNLLLLISPNGRGKSSILEAIAAIKEIVSPYHSHQYSFNEHRENRNIKIWPNHLNDPVKIGCAKAEIKIEVEATGSDTNYLTANGIEDTIGTAHIIIENKRDIVSVIANKTMLQLCKFHTPDKGGGYVDYIRATRIYQRRGNSGISVYETDHSLRQTLSDFHLDNNQQSKYSLIKDYVIQQQLSDTSDLQATRNSEEPSRPKDSLLTFRETFNFFFNPKRYLGFKVLDNNPMSADIYIESPFGTHNIDSLSDGEKEMLHILAHLHKFHFLSNIILWDTPESHLNSQLQSRLCHAITKIAPQNQYWIATHGVELINSVSPESYFVLRQDDDAVRIERTNSSNDKVKISIFSDLGANVGLQLVSNLTVFVEGKNSSLDKRILTRVFTPRIPAITFVAGDSCDNILLAGSRANALLEKAVLNGDFLAIIDRDYLEQNEVNELQSKYNNRVFIWSVHEIENLFLDANLLYQTLLFLGRIDESYGPEKIYSDLQTLVRDLADWIAADWVAWESSKAVSSPPRRISGEQPLQSLLDYSARLKDKVQDIADNARIQHRFEEKRKRVDILINSDQAFQVLPGKQILAQYLKRFPILHADDFVMSAVGLMNERALVVPELQRLSKTLELLRGS